MKLRSLFLIGLLMLGLTASAQEPMLISETPVLEIDLQKAIEIALADNPTIKVAEKDIQLKKVADTEAWMNLLPTLSGSVSLQHSVKVAAIKTQMGSFKMGMDGSTTGVGALTLNLPLFAPAVYRNMQLTKEDILLAQEKARGSRLDLIQQVSKAYYSVLMAKDALEVMKRSMQVAQENFDVVNNKFKVGSVSEYDKITAEVQVRNLNAAVVSAEAGLKLAKLQLKVLMGITADVTLNIPDELRNYESQAIMDEANASVIELGNNSALRQLDYSANLLKKTRKILQTNFMPTLGMQFAYQYQSYSNDNWNVFGWHYSPSSTLSFSLSIPIFTASNWTKLKTNRLQQEQLADNRKNVENQLKMAVESYRSNMQSSLVQLGSNLEAVNQAKKAVQIAEKRYNIGGGTMLELNQAENALTQAELTYNQTIYDFITNKVDLDYTLGKE